MPRLSDLYAGYWSRQGMGGLDPNEEQKLQRQLRIETMLSTLSAMNRPDGQGGAAALGAAVEGRQREREALAEYRWRQEQEKARQEQLAQEALQRQREQARLEQEAQRKRALEEMHRRVAQESGGDEGVMARANAARDSGDMGDLVNLYEGIRAQRAKDAAYEAAGVGRGQDERALYDLRQKELREAQVRAEVEKQYPKPKPERAEKANQLTWIQQPDGTSAPYNYDPDTGTLTPAKGPAKAARQGPDREEALVERAIAKWMSMDKAQQGMTGKSEDEFIGDYVRLLRKHAPGAAESPATPQAPQGQAGGGAASDADSALKELEDLDPTAGARMRRAYQAAPPALRGQVLADIRAGISLRKSGRR